MTINELRIREKSFILVFKRLGFFDNAMFLIFDFGDIRYSVLYLIINFMNSKKRKKKKDEITAKVKQAYYYQDIFWG